MRAHVVLPLIAVAALLAIPLRATTVVMRNDEWLVRTSEAIITGTVVQSETRLGSTNHIETVYRMAVDEVLKGEFTQSIDVVVPGGRLGDRMEVVSGSPVYASGRRYLIFLMRDRDAHWTTHDLALGRFEFQGSRLTRDLSDIGGAIAEGPRDGIAFLDFIRREVRQATRRVTSDFKAAPLAFDLDLESATTIGAAAWTNDSQSDVSYSMSTIGASGYEWGDDDEDRVIADDPQSLIAGTFPGTSEVVAEARFGCAACEGETHTYNGETYSGITFSDVIINDGVSSSNVSQGDLNTAVTHELGHTLGVRHSDLNQADSGSCHAPLDCSTTALMYSGLNPGLNGVLQTWDQSAIRALYGSGSGGSKYAMLFFDNIAGRRANNAIAYHVYRKNSIWIDASKTITEGNSGTSTMSFTVKLNEALTSQATVDWTTNDGTATGGIDFVASSGTLIFTVGQTSKTIPITINGDGAGEYDETFTVTLSNCSNCVIERATGTGTITNDDLKPGERDALVAFYNSTNGASWTTKTNWLGAEGTECTWYGVTCNGTTTVKWLQLAANNLTGTIPSGIDALTGLKIFSIADNAVTGTIPSSLANCSLLQAINMNYNQLTGTIPSGIGSLASLFELSLLGNQLSGSLPDFSSAQTLQNLFLSDNDLSGSIPSTLGSASHMHYLWLDGNQLTGAVPSSLGNLTNLAELELNGNALDGDLPSTLTALTGVTTLTIHHNALYATNSAVDTWATARESDWKSTQTIAPTNVAVTATTDTTATLTWTPIAYTTDTGGYEVWADSGSGAVLKTTTANKSATGTTVTGLTALTTYTFTVRTKTNSNGSNQNTLYSAFTSGVNGTTIAAFGAPPSFSATGVSGTQVNLSWIAVSTATSYEIYRSTNGTYSLLMTTSTNSYSDTSVTANLGYLYKVRAKKTGSTSAFSTPDAATTVVFTDASLSTIKAVHITQLRTAVNGLRTAAGLTTTTFTDNTLSTIKAVHVTELRTALDAARVAALVASLVYTDPTITVKSTKVKAAHTNELRAGTQ